MSEENNAQDIPVEGKESSQELDLSEGRNPVKIALKMVVGILLIILGVVLIARWWTALVTVFKGCFGLFLILVGLIVFAIAKE